MNPTKIPSRVRRGLPGPESPEKDFLEKLHRKNINLDNRLRRIEDLVKDLYVVLQGVKIVKKVDGHEGKFMVPYRFENKWKVKGKELIYVGEGDE